MEDETVIRVDAQNRVSLHNLAKHKLYLAHLEPDDTIIMRPAVIVPASDLKNDTSE